MGRAHAWVTVFLTCFSVFFASWMVCESWFRLDESKSLALASLASAVAALPLAPWAQGRTRRSSAARISGGRPAWVLFATANTPNVIILVVVAITWGLTGTNTPSAQHESPNNAQRQEEESVTSTPLTDVVKPPPHRETVFLAGQQTAAMIYSLSSKGCPESSITLDIALNGNVSTVNATFSLDDRTASTVRTGLTSTTDGVSTDQGVLSAQSGKTLDLDVRGKNSLSFTLATLGRTEGPCSDASYILALDGQVIE